MAWSQPQMTPSYLKPVVYDHIKVFDESYPYIGNHDKELVECLREENVKVLQIYGAVYLGKTRLAKAVARLYGEEVNSDPKNRLKVHLYMVKFMYCTSRQAFLQELCFKCGIGKADEKDPLVCLRETWSLGDCSSLFIIDGVNFVKDDKNLEEIQDCIQELAEETKMRFIITSRIRLCFPRMSNKEYFEYPCSQMMPNYAEQLLRTAAGNPPNLHEEAVKKIIGLTKRVPWAIILAGQKMNSSKKGGIHYSAQDIIELLERSVIDALTLQFAPKADQIGHVLKEYFNNLTATEKIFVAKLDKYNISVGSLTTTTAAEIAHQNTSEVKLDFLESLVDKSLLSPRGKSFESNDWLDQYLKERFLEFVDHSSMDEFLDKIRCLINEYLKSRGYTQGEINKVLSIQHRVGQPLKEAFFNLLDLDSNAHPDVRSALRVKVIDAATIFIGKGFPEGTYPLEFAKAALATLTSVEDGGHQLHGAYAMSNKTDQLNRQNPDVIEEHLVMKPDPGPEPIAEISPTFHSIRVGQQPTRECSSNRQFSLAGQGGSLTSPTLHLDQPNQTLTSASELQAEIRQRPVQSSNNKAINAPNAKLSPVDANNNDNLQSFHSLSTIPDHTKLPNQMSTNISEHNDSQSKSRQLGTSDPEPPPCLKSTESKMGTTTSVAHQTSYFQENDQVFLSNRGDRSSDSDIHSLKSHPPISPEMWKKTVGANGGMELPTVCADYKLSINLITSDQRQLTINKHSSKPPSYQETSWENVPKERCPTQLQPSEVPPPYRNPLVGRHSQGQSEESCDSSSYQAELQLEEDFRQMTLHPENPKDTGSFIKDHQFRQISSRETSGNMHPPRDGQIGSSSQTNKPNQMTPPETSAYQTAEFDAINSSNSHTTNTFPVTVTTAQRQNMGPDRFIPAHLFSQERSPQDSRLPEFRHHTQGYDIARHCPQQHHQSSSQRPHPHQQPFQPRMATYHETNPQYGQPHQGSSSLHYYEPDQRLPNLPAYGHQPPMQRYPITQGSHQQSPPWSPPQVSPGHQQQFTQIWIKNQGAGQQYQPACQNGSATGVSALQQQPQYSPEQYPPVDHQEREISPRRWTSPEDREQQLQRQRWPHGFNGQYPNMFQVSRAAYESSGVQPSATQQQPLPRRWTTSQIPDPQQYQMSPPNDPCKNSPKMNQYSGKGPDTLPFIPASQPNGQPSQRIFQYPCQRPVEHYGGSQQSTNSQRNFTPQQAEANPAARMPNGYQHTTGMNPGHSQPHYQPPAAPPR